ncbi:flavin-containing monooxygenase [Pseudonocardia sp. GCM10023141]|uniref:flavin-containing monooxygenase n=1 Tax=Pseudonocardia sp. GCM10023141 TaxID=3252653 RepID=UPI00360915E2
MTSSANDDEIVDILCIGAGFGGLYVSYRATRAGFTVAGFERAEAVGGTWYWNRYPGARCDIESIYYSYSFSEELQQEWEWSERFATQPEILHYLDHVAVRFDLRRHFTFGTSVVAATWLEDERLWQVELDSGEIRRGRHLVSAVGCLSTAKTPDVPGIERFTGTTVSTSNWDLPMQELAGKRVAVIGTGSSGVQCIPLIAEVAQELTVFQRTPNYVMPARNAPLDQEFVARIKTDYAAVREECRRSTRGFPDRPTTQRAFDVAEEERRRRYEAAYLVSGFTSVGDEFVDLLTDLDANETAARFLRDKVREVVNDPGKAALLEPRYHPFGAKRTCFGTDYYETFNRSNVELVSLRHEPIVDMTARSIRTGSREVEIDVLVLATGFDAVTGSLLKLGITTSTGRSLATEWASGPRTYLGLTTAGFPNFYMIGGPQSPGVLSNFVVSIEQHVDWVTELLVHIRERGVDRVDVDPGAQDDWVDLVDKVVGETLYATTESWYRGANIPGKPASFLAYAGGVGNYREICDEVATHGYRGLRLTPADEDPSPTGTAPTRTRTGAAR